jgi:polar amino acid transport system substrate-binding protein
VKKTILTITSIFLVIAAFNSCIARNQHGLTITEGVLAAGVEVGYPPMEYYDVDGVTLLGFNIELINALAEKLGLKVNYIDTAWEGILAGLDAGRYDIAVNITIIPERQERFNFTKPYIDSSMTIVAAANSSIKIDKPEDIAGYRVAFQGNTTAQYFTDRLREQGVRFTSFAYDKIIYCFSDLQLGRIDLVVVDNIAAFYYTQQTGNENSTFKIIWQGPSDEYIGICLRKGNDALTEALNNALDELFYNGTLLEISKKIFNDDLVTKARRQSE